MKYCLLLFLVLPASAETLHYVINWPSGLSLGEATITFNSQAAASGPKSAVAWSSDFEIDASLPGFAITDHYHSSAEGKDMCSVKLDKTVRRGARKSEETDTFHQDTHTVTRETHGAAAAPATSMSPLVPATRSRSWSSRAPNLPRDVWPRGNR